MKLLWLTKNFPYPAHGGDLIYSKNLIEGCAKLGAKIHVICQEPTSNGGAITTNLGNLTWNVLRTPMIDKRRAALAAAPNIVARYATAERLAATRQALLEDFDAIIFDSLAALSSFDLVRDLAKGRRIRPILVHISHNHEASTSLSIARNTPDWIMRAVHYADAWKTRRLERRLVAGCDLLVVNTAEDWALYRPDCPNVRHLVITPGYSGTASPPRDVAHLPRRVIVLGSYQWGAKRLNLEALLKSAASAFPAAEVDLRVVGFMDASYRQRLTDQFPWASIVGPVERIDDELAKARIGIVPEQAGGGFKHKTLNYVFGRVPIAGIDVAMAGAPLSADRDYISAHDVDGLVQSVVANIDRPEFLQSIADDALAKCETAFRWDDRCRSLFAAIESLVAQNRATH